MPPPLSLSYTTNFCTLTRNRAVELTMDPRQSYLSLSTTTPPQSCVSTPSDSSTSSATPLGPEAATTNSGTDSVNNVDTTNTNSDMSSNSQLSTNLPTHGRASPLAITIHETKYTTHTGYIVDIAARPALELSAMKGTFHWRALALVRRAIEFHMGLLRGDDDNDEDGIDRGMKEKARTFVDGVGDIVVGRLGGEILIAPAQLLRLKAVINYLTPDNLLATMAWIESHEMARVAVGLETGNLGMNQQWCGNCARLFYIAAGDGGRISPGAFAKDPMGIKECGHVMCKGCVVNWLHDVTAKGRKGTQPCCVRFRAFDEATF
ncbi:uncharacterized protein BKCO1_6400037 [Diplodia corticola]|uniref:Zinc finger C3HC4 RING-type domain-containing protein n=1 Tax=Diplodia corticola TaxID=236234 RepID=A0A1J9QMW3_9PEZI|nr:uncharacterized protein BKCO1_6400037 [Diplodia corticola]OJD30222.1 hypothetical protein BKCO1_6400037 [Diplodia corticola]